MERPVDGVAAGHVPGADDGVGAGVEQAQQVRERRPGRGRSRRPSTRSRRSPRRARSRSRRGRRSPDPCLPGRRSTLICPSSAATSSTSAAVPSGLLSSTTRMSASGSVERTAPSRRVDVLTLVVGRQHDDRTHEGPTLLEACSHGTRQKTWSTPSAEASHVSVRRVARAAHRMRARRSASSRTAAIASPSCAGAQARPSAVDDRAAMAADVGRHGRRAAGRAFGQGQTPALGQRAAGHDPRPAVLGAQLVALDVAQQVHPARRRRGPRSRPPAPARCGPSPMMCSRSSGTRRRASLGRLQQQLEALDGRHPPGGHDQRRGVLRAARREVGAVDAVVDRGHPLRPEPQLQQLVARRLRTA